MLHAIHISSLVKVYSSFGKPLEMINPDVCIIYNAQAVYTDLGGVAIEQDEEEAIAKAVSEKNKCVILQNYGLLTTGKTVDEAGYLFTMMERSCECQLFADAAALGGREKKIIPDSEALYTASVEGDPAKSYLDFQNDLSYEIAMDYSFMTFSRK